MGMITISIGERCANGKTGSEGEVIVKEKVGWILDRDNCTYLGSIPFAIDQEVMGTSTLKVVCL